MKKVMNVLITGLALCILNTSFLLCKNQVITTFEFLERPWSYKNFFQELEEAKLHEILSKRNLQGGIYTVFAPIDSAFHKFGRLGFIKAKEVKNKDRLLIKFIGYHIIPGKIDRIAFRRHPNRKRRTLAGEEIRYRDIGNILYSVETSSGIVHVLDHVLINPTLNRRFGIR